jgi:hypothetical protein
MSMILRTTLIAGCLLLTACLSARPWYEKELKAWIGAPVSELENAWGPPTRTIIGKSGLPEMVYQSTTYRDDQEDVKRDPNLLLSDRPPSPRPQIDELECDMRFRIENDIVVGVSHDGAGCQVVPRPGKSPRS